MAKVAVSERAGKPAEASMLVDVGRLVDAYYDIHPDPSVPAQAVAFGTSGHRGSSLNGSFNEDHILATSEAICRYRKSQGIAGPLFIGKDSHALSDPATRTALEVLVANGVSVLVDSADGLTPTPAVSHAILTYNRGRTDGLADGIVVTPSHNPPEDGGFKYNPPNGGPADTDVTGAIQAEANALLRAGLRGVSRVAVERALGLGRPIRLHRAPTSPTWPTSLDMEAIRAAGLKLGVDPLGGASVGYWAAIRDRYGLDLTVTNEVVDPQFGFMTVDWDGRIRMDPSSPYAMARLVALKDRFDVAFANDTDADRHGIVAGSAGLMNPNHFLSAAVAYLYRQPRLAARRGDRQDAGLHEHARPRRRGAGPEAAGGAGRVQVVRGRAGRRLPRFRRRGERRGLVPAPRRHGLDDRQGRHHRLPARGRVDREDRPEPGVAYEALTARFGAPAYRRIDAPATREQKAILSKLSPAQIRASTLAGEPIVAVLTRAPGNDAPIGGVKVVTEHGWFAARPSGTEDVYKVYAESFLGEEHLARIIEEAQAVVAQALSAAG